MRPEHKCIHGIQGFLWLQRDIGININDFLVHYEFLYQKLQKFSMTLSDRVLAFTY